MAKNHLSTKFFGLAFLCVILLGVVVYSTVTWNLAGVEVVYGTLAGNGSFTTLINGSICEVNESRDLTSMQINISINNTRYSSGVSNISEVNVTLPTGITFYTTGRGFNSTNITAEAYGFATFTNTSTNTSTILSWYNSSAHGVVPTYGKIGNVSVEFWFNVTFDDPGIYNITVSVNNGSVGNTTGKYNLTIQVNDTTSPSLVNYTADSYINYINLSQSYIWTAINVTDNGKLCTMNITLWNANNVSINSTTNISMGTNMTQGYTFRGLSDGVYYLNATVNDTFNNTNTTKITRRITIDTTNPTITFNCTPATVNVGEAVTCACSGTDALSGVETTTYTANPSTTNSGVHEQTCTVTDYAGNFITSTVSFTVSSGGSRDDGSSSGSSSSQWVGGTITTITPAQLEAGTARSVGAKGRLKITVNNAIHQIGVTKVTTTSVTIEVSSTPQTATLNIGDVKKFDVDGDGKYDIQVTLNSITSGKANLSVKSVTGADAIIPAATTNKTSTTTTPSATEKGKSNWWIYLIVVVVLLIIIGVITFGKKKK